MIIRLLQENPSLSANALAEKRGITPHVVERHINKLKADDILFRDGADNGDSWVILSGDKKDVSHSEDFREFTEKMLCSLR